MTMNFKGRVCNFLCLAGFGMGAKQELVIMLSEWQGPESCRGGGVTWQIWVKFCLRDHRSLIRQSLIFHTASPFVPVTGRRCYRRWFKRCRQCLYHSDKKRSWKFTMTTKWHKGMWRAASPQLIKFHWCSQPFTIASGSVRKAFSLLCGSVWRPTNVLTWDFPKKWLESLFYLSSGCDYWYLKIAPAWVEDERTERSRQRRDLVLLKHHKLLANKRMGWTTLKSHSLDFATNNSDANAFVYCDPVVSFGANSISGACFSNFLFFALLSVTSQDSPISAASSCCAMFDFLRKMWQSNVMNYGNVYWRRQSSGREESRLSLGICSECPHCLTAGRTSGVASLFDKFEVLFVSLWLANTEVSAYHPNASLISVEFIWLTFSNWILNWFSNICHPTQPRQFQFAVCLRFKWIPEAS